MFEKLFPGKSMLKSSGLVLLLFFTLTQIRASEITLTLKDSPFNGTYVFMLFDSPSSFGDLRDPFKTSSFVSSEETIYTVSDIPAGDYAFIVYFDENKNGRLDRNFIGIPLEPIFFSNNYRPHGPPVFNKAKVSLPDNSALKIDLIFLPDVEHQGGFSMGVGLLARSSPYLGSKTTVIRVIPALTYMGERLLLLGPNIQWNLIRSGDFKLAATFMYRMGVYEEKDSTILEGMGDRKNTLFAGLDMQYALPFRIKISLLAATDALDKTGGTSVKIKLSKSFQAGSVRLSPSLALNWQDSTLSNYDFGVPQTTAREGRPFYTLDETVNYETGINAMIELPRNWSFIFQLSAELLDEDISGSPIVSKDYVLKSFLALSCKV